jgi:2-keto-3-deoxy-6-phosphogluconate aldolase
MIEYAGDRALIGAGTVLTAEQVSRSPQVGRVTHLLTTARR